MGASLNCILDGVLFDGACGTGGMLTVGEERIRELAKTMHKDISVHLYGQENADETYAIAKADMLLKGEEADHIAYGSTISDDKFAGKTFDFCLSIPCSDLRARLLSLPCISSQICTRTAC